MKTHAYGFWCAWLLGMCGVAGGPLRAAGISHPLRIGISEDIVGEVNNNDLRAVVKVWSDAVSSQTGVWIVPRLLTTDQLVEQVRNRQLDAFSLNILEFMRVASYADPRLVVDQYYETGGDEYLLLVPAASNIRTVADLRGRSLILYQNTRTCLAKIWLETLFAQAHLGPVDSALGRIEYSTKLMRVVLPVFFGQSNACLVTRRGFETMCELNPQLGKQLRSLEASPKLLTTFMAFCKDVPEARKQKFLTALESLHKTAAGRQALMLFGGSRLVVADGEGLRESRDLLRAYARIKGKPAVGGE
jgi:ABC-type phosphate/phosphonate transport system substrate-binding protein